jgi:predicted RNase H-like HicB family nuclease
MMASQWNVLVEKTEDGKAIATVLEFPTLSAIADTRQDAIDRAQQLLAERLAQGEIVPIQVESSKNPVLETFGIFKDDPHFEDVQRYIQKYRDELDAIDDEDLTD